MDDAGGGAGDGAESEDFFVLGGETGQGLAPKVTKLCDGVLCLRKPFLELGVVGFEPVDLRDLRVGSGPGLLKASESFFELGAPVGVGAVAVEL